VLLTYLLHGVSKLVTQMAGEANLFALFLQSRKQRRSDRKVIVYLPF